MKLSKYALSAALLCIPLAMNPMGRFKSYFQSSRHTFNTLCKAVNLGLTFGPMWLPNLGTPKFLQAIDQLPNASPEVTEFFQEQCKIAGVEKPYSVTVKEVSGMPSKAAINCLNNTIIVGSNPYDVESIATALKARKNLDLGKPEAEHIDETISLYRAIGQHEATHLKYNDNLTKVSASLLLPFATHWSFKGLRALRQLNMQRNIALTPTVGNSIKYVFGGVGKGMINSLSMCVINYQMELRADRGVQDNIEVLKAAANDFAENDKGESLHMKQLLLSKNITPSPVAISIAQQISHPHYPLLATRIARHEERIAKLKDQKNQSSIADPK